MRVKCDHCTENVGPRSVRYCDYHAGWHAGYSKAAMGDKRASVPGYREKERQADKIRMQKRRERERWLRVLCG
jgi:hypothetical protein